MTKQECNQTLPLSLSQREVWLDQIAWPNSAHLNIGGCLDLNGKIDHELMQSALQLLINESMCLRSVLLAHGKQRVLDNYKNPFEYLDFSSKANPMTQAREWQQQWMRKPFDVFVSPAWRFALIKISEEQHLVVIQFHHFIMDGWGTLQVIQRWGQLYSSLIENREVSSSPLDYQNFISASNEFLETGSEKERAFWLKEFKEPPEPLFEKKFSTDNKAILPDAHLIAHTIKKESYQSVVDTAVQFKTTSYHWVIAALVVYFARTENRKKITIGVPNLNRSGKRYKSTLGMFVNVLPLTIVFCPKQPFSELVKEISGKLRNIYRHSRLPVSEMIKQLNSKAISKESIFDIIFSFEKQDYECQFGQARITRSHQTFSTYARYPLGITLCEFHEEQDIELIVEGNSLYFSRQGSKLIAQRLEFILHQTAISPDIGNGSVQLLDSQEMKYIHNELHGKVQHHNSSRSFLSLFYEQVEKSQNSIALLNDSLKLNYQQLDRASDVLAHQLINKGAKSGDRVVIFMPKSLEMVISLLAIVKADCTFIPVDTEQPLNRLNYIKESANVDFVLELNSLSSRMSLPTLNVNIDELLNSQTVIESINKKAGFQVNSLAYILFTSGTTGKPKGVKISHDSLAKKLNYIADLWQVTSADRAGQLIQSHFDPSLIEILVPLITGASVAIPASNKLTPEEMVAFAEKFQITFMAFVPLTLSSFIKGMNDKRDINLRVACCGGEALSKDLAKRFIEHTGARLFNVYGPTETCIFSTSYQIQSECSDIKLPVGYPTDDTRVYVLDDSLGMLPIGVCGEIYLGGSSISQGYVAEENSNKFFENPYVQGERIYRTGDKGWLDEKGCLHFSGRVDRQVKLHGYRIELEEIEACLLSIDGIEAAAVAVCEAEKNEFICAWVEQSKQCSEQELRSRLRLFLPDYMLPSRIIHVDHMPSTSNGKIDYKALSLETLNVLPFAPREAQGPIEKALLEIWHEVLETTKISTSDNFFALGGDSMAAIIMLTQIESKLNVKLPLSTFVANPTIQSLACAIEKYRNQAELLISLGQDNCSQTLYIAASGHGDLLRFTALAEELKGICNVYMLQPPVNTKEISFENLAELYADIIIQKSSGAIFMAGFSVGGITALETSSLLNKKGVAVEELFLIDTILLTLPSGGIALWKAFSWLSLKLRIGKSSYNNGRASTILNDVGLYSQVQAMNNYKPKAYSGFATLIKTSILTYFDRILFAKWRNVFMKKLTEKEIQGKHGTIFNPGSVHQLAKELANRIERRKQEQPDNLVALGASTKKLKK